MPSIGPMELIVILVIALLVLGPKRLPSAGRSLGEGLRGFKESINGESSSSEGGSRDELAASETPASRVE
jgi:sec-independent protein translocase protein TatA